MVNGILINFQYMQKYFFLTELDNLEPKNFRLFTKYKHFFEYPTVVPLNDLAVQQLAVVMSWFMVSDHETDQPTYLF